VCPRLGLPAGPECPTATHELRIGHAIDCHSVSNAERGEGSRDHTVPLHLSTKPRSISPLPEGLNEPTAMHQVGEAQTTEWRTLETRGPGVEVAVVEGEVVP
jgi:hypothetical protein